MRSRISFTDLVSLLFILLWTYAAASKILDFQNFKIQLGKSPLINGFATLTAVMVPLIELALAALLLFDKTKRTGLFGSLALISTFTTYLIVILNFSYYIPCSCGGIIGKGMSWQTHIIFNLFFVALGAASILFRDNSKQKSIVSNINQIARS